VAASTADLIRQAVERLQTEVPALAKLKLVFGLVELPGPKISKGFADDERVHVALARSHFNELATDGRARHWREAFERGHVKVEGDPNVQKLIGQLIARTEARGRLKKAR
jgi:hypothetical protein